MLLKHKLSRVFFFSVVSILLVLLGVIYRYSVPFINDKVYETEINSSRLVLNNVFDLANEMNLNLMSYQREILNGHKRNMKVVVDLAASYIKVTLATAKQDNLSSQQVYSKIYEGLRSFSYENNNYVWVVDKQSKILSHPDPKLHGMKRADLLDTHGDNVVDVLVSKALNYGDGFYQYPWQQADEDKVLEKISYIKYFPEWDIFVGTSVYVNDIKEAVSTRKATVVNELRSMIKDIVIANTGYLFIFDEQGNMLVHPNDNIESTNALTLKDPMTGQSMLQELMDVADTDKELVYQWDKPSDPNNYSYDKLSLVRYVAGLGWYICSSVYVEELQRSGKLFSEHILTISLLALLIATFFALLFASWITHSITQLAAVAKKVSQGDLTLTSGIKRKDEFGILGAAFDHMITQLRDNITTLDLTVASRTEALVKSNQQLQQAMLESKQVQQQLMQAQRMNAVGQLAGGLAHDFNNILTIILGNLIAAEKRFQDNIPLLKKLTPAIRASRRGTDITNRLLSFSRRQSLQPSRITITRLIDETVDLMRGSLPSTVKIETHFSNQLLQVHVDPSQFDNCLINLLLNAKDAMPTGGTIHINVNERFIASSDSKTCANFDERVPAGSYVVIDVVDNGDGFTDDAKSMAFEPFYTTKSSGQGSGLGLSMVFGFIKQSRGFIRLSNGHHGGAKITLLLPMLVYQSLPLNQGRQIKEDNDTEYKDKLMLLVEDDFDVRAVVREQLVSFGFNVIEACDSAEAEQLIMAIPHLFGMVSDISMPGAKSGFELAEYLLSQLPESKVVLMSGHVFDNDKPLSNTENVMFLRKPFSSCELRYAIDNAVNKSVNKIERKGECAS